MKEITEKPSSMAALAGFDSACGNLVRFQMRKDQINCKNFMQKSLSYRRE